MICGHITCRFFFLSPSNWFMLRIWGVYIPFSLLGPSPSQRKQYTIAFLCRYGGGGRLRLFCHGDSTVQSILPCLEFFCHLTMCSHVVITALSWTQEINLCISIQRWALGKEIKLKPLLWETHLGVFQERRRDTLPMRNLHGSILFAAWWSTSTMFTQIWEALHRMHINLCYSTFTDGIFSTGVSTWWGWDWC